MEENMTTERTRNPYAFAVVLEELVRARDLEPNPENIRSLAARSGLDADGLLQSMVAEEPEDLGHLSGLADEMALSHEEKTVLAGAYVYNWGTAEEARAAARKREAEEQVSAHDAAFVITEMLEGATDLEDAELIEDVRSKLPLVGAGELVSQLREAEGVTSGLMTMGSALSPATHCILACANARAVRALEVAEGLSSKA
jgi:hypothetical protein